MSLKWTSLAATAVLVLAVVGLYLEHALFATQAWAIAVQGLAVLLMIWARLTFGARSFHAGANPTGGGIVTTGPYWFVRHPIYAAILFGVWAGIASHPSVPAALVAAVASGAVAVRIACEERLVIERYPEYREYAARTKRVLPFVI